MPRRTRPEKPYIIVFCEGESEQAYTDFLRKEFRDVASIKRPRSTGLFEEADNKFKKDKSYRDYAALKMKLVGRDKVLGPKPAEDILAVEETEEAAE